MATNTGNLGHPHWTIRKVAADDEDFYLQRIKPFRLAALQQDPDAFGSNYARELAFEDEAWLARLRNPLATTFAAVRDDPSLASQDARLPEVMGTVTLHGPVPGDNRDDTFLAQNCPDRIFDVKERSVLLAYHLTGVYTTSKSRGLGIGKALIEAAVVHARCHWVEERWRVIRVEVFADNMTARLHYSKCGFVVFEADGVKKEDGGRRTFSMYRLVDSSLNQG